jgi:G3E family GTPase
MTLKAQKLLIIAGFLGSGKTTLLLQIARRLNLTSQRIAIIENEMGEIGVDGNYLSLEGLHVQELFGGCVCCTLSVGLIDTLEKVEQLYHPDLVILEATGIARPGDIIDNLHLFRSKAVVTQVITIVDATRYEMLMKILAPLLIAQIQVAHIVAINKIDQMKPKLVDQITRSVSSLNPQAKCIAICAEDSTRINKLMDRLL